MKKVGVAKVGARFRVRLRQVLQLSSGFRLENGAAIAVVGAPSSARKVLRLAQASDDLPGQFPSMVIGLPTSMSAGSSSAFARRELFDFASQVALAYSKALLPWNGSWGKTRKLISNKIADVSAGPSQALASLNLPVQAAHSARYNLAPLLRA